MRAAFCILCLLASAAFAQNDSGPETAKPAVTWTFDKAEPGLPAKASTDAGPRPPSYPGFAANNAAYRFSGTGITIKETDLPEVNLRFVKGESITLEAWVNVSTLKDGSYSYIIGKGRSKSTAKNQNYALRLHGVKGQATITFLFASESEGKEPGDWHRWISTGSFPVNGAWHHVAVSYTFGDPKSIHGYIDGQHVTGAWDMGGATTRGPVSDNDHLQIGTGNGGGANNAFTGLVDNVAVWRTIIPEATLTSRYQHVPPPPAVDVTQIPRGKVLVQLCTTDLPDKNAWPDVPPPSSETYLEDCFGFFDVPQFYTDDGVRGERANPFLLRASAKVTLPPGEHRILLRGRGATRLFIDGKLLLSTPFPPTDTSGHGHVREPGSYLNLGPDFRFAPPGNRESWHAFTSKGGTHVVLLETLVGGHLGKNKRRPELGETVAAISLAGTEAWTLLTAGNRTVSYTDAGWAAYEAERAAKYDEVNAAERAKKRSEHEAYWNSRRAAATTWLKSAPEVPVPPMPAGHPASNAIDHFLAKTLAETIEQKKAAGRSTVDYFKQVQPLLETKCYGCHIGDKPKGGLKLDNRKTASDAVSPGKPADSSLLTRVKSKDEDDRMPPKGDALTAEQVQMLETWIREGATWPDLNASHTTVTPLCDDYTFLRRVYLDTVGVVPTLAEIRAFEADTSPEKRAKLIDKLLTDNRWADHWTGYWQDVLAENPNILNPTLNNTGPFRWWIYESLRDNVPMDRFATQLLRMRGSERFGGPAGFAVASQNDAPLAAKGTIVTTAFLGVEMKCARCHDAPSHRSKQEDLFQIAAMLSTKPMVLPKTSSVPLDKIHDGGRKPLINVTLKPGSTIAAKWPFDMFVKGELGPKLAEDANDPRDVLAALVTAPQNERFSQVMANRVWQRLMGRGIVEPVDDWEKGKPSHPELLKWLGRELVRSGYDAKALTRLILNSHAYQRASDPAQLETGVLFAATAQRRLPAEAIVDSLFVATGKPFELEEVSLDIDGIREMNSSLTLGQPRRSWMLTSTSNERDRPSLSLPRIQIVTDVLTAYGWRGSRQDPTSNRDHNPNVLQPAILSNGVMGLWLTRLSDDHGFTDVALNAKSTNEIVETLFLRTLTRKPTDAEAKKFTEYLSAGFDTRVRTATAEAKPHVPVPYVSWSNHLDSKANSIKTDEEAALRQGPTPTGKLDPAWRVKLENVVWAVVNSPECIYRP
ncbi:DUF1553 domain-containing protein [soil metagenome]